MSGEQKIPLLWRGRATIDEVLARLKPSVSIEIRLAAEYHHALFRALHPDAPPGAPEDIDVVGNPGLLDKISAINGLEDMAALIAPLTKLGATIRVSGRAKITIAVAALDPTDRR